MTVLILDGCRVFVSDEPLADGSTYKHGLKVPEGKLKMTRDTLVAHACAPSADAADTGEDSTEKNSICD